MSSSRDYLVFVRVGKKSLHRDWLKGPGERTWDIQYSQYDDDPDIGQGGDLPLSVDKGTKWDSIYRYLMANPALLDRYRYIAFMDDDLVFTKQSLNRYFEICEEHELLLAQPSLHPDSYFCYAILMQCPHTKLRYTNFVECMATAIRTDYLRSFLPHLSRVVSGWGMDRIWAVTMPEPAFRTAVIDEISMVHTRPHAAGTSDVYKAFSQGSLSPSAEMESIIASYEGIPDKMLVYGALDRDGTKIGATRAQTLNGVSLIANFWRYRHPLRALRTALGMFVRAVTQAGYQPGPAHRLSQEAL